MISYKGLIAHEIDSLSLGIGTNRTPYPENAEKVTIIVIMIMTQAACFEA